MRLSRRFFAVFFVGFVAGCNAFVLLHPVNAQAAKTSPTKWVTYGNTRYKFSVSYPSNLMTAQREADNGDGRAFVSHDGKTRMLAYGTNNVLDETLQARYKHDARGIEPGDKVTYKVQKNNWYAVSGYRADLIFYRKTFVNDGQFLTLDVTYPKSQRAKWDKIVTQIVQGFRLTR